MSFTKYPKNWHANGYGWHNSAALTYGKGSDATSETSSGVSSMHGGGGGGGAAVAMPMPMGGPNIGFQMTYGFAPGVLPSQVPNAIRDMPTPSATGSGAYPSLGWAFQSDTSSFDGVSDVAAVSKEEVPCQAIFVPADEMPIYGTFNGLLRGAGQQILNEAMNAAGEYIGNAIQEMLVVKKTAEVPRILPSINHMKVLGEKGSGLRSHGGDIQDFHTIRNQCLQNGVLFEDPEFPAVDSSLQFSSRPDRPIQWLRPMEIADDPQFFVEGYSRFDVQQGELGDCWLLAATATLTQDPKLFFRVVPDDQSFDDSYAGCFHFRFWQYGRWIDVVIDDRLPTYRGELLYMHSTEKNEFWSALLEKAYAKLHGSYEALKGGTTCEAMEDFTGGVTEMYELKEAPPNLFSILVKAFERNSMMGCSIEPDPNVLEAETPMGLIRGHAYSLTKVQLMDIVTPNTRGQIPMVRMRNPWGNEAEWSGPWSDQSSEWRYIPEHVKIDIGLTFDHDGEFWMSFADWMKHFDRVELCNLSPDSLSEEQESGGKKKWEMSVFEGEWTAGISAGGCRNYLDTFWHNPQYVVSLEEPDDDDDEGKCTVIIGLMQKNRRSKRNIGMDCLTIGFAVYSVSDRELSQKPLKMNFFKYNASVARSPAFINLREVSCRFKLPPGNYLIVPSTFEPNEEAEFLIRVFSENKNHMEENDQDVGIGQIDERINPDVPILVPQKSAMEKLFIDIAGDDMEVDWMELKRILDHSMRDDFGPASHARNGYETAAQGHSVQGAATGNGDEGGGGGGGDFISGLLATLCGAFCKDNPLGESLGLNQTSAGVEANIQPTQPISNQIIQSDEETGFSKDVCRSMVAMMDVDSSGKLGFEEFKTLLTEIAKWKAVFKLYDRDNSGKLSAFELREALNSAGYQLNNKILNALAHRYSDREGMVAFDDFIMCSVKLKTMIDLYKQRDIDGRNSATFSMEDWLEQTAHA